MKKILLTCAIGFAAMVSALNAAPPDISNDVSKTLSVDEKVTVAQPITDADVGQCHYVVPLTTIGETVLAKKDDLTITGFNTPCPTGQVTYRIKDKAGENKAPCPANDTGQHMAKSKATTVTAKLQVPVDVGKTTPMIYAHATAGKKVSTGRYC